MELNRDCLPMHLRLTMAQFNATAVEQERKGMEKYGIALDPLHEQNDKYDWLQMAEEELVDAFKYFMAERRRRDAILNESMITLRTLVDDILNVRIGPTEAVEGIRQVEKYLSKILGTKK